MSEKAMQREAQRQRKLQVALSKQAGPLNSTAPAGQSLTPIEKEMQAAQVAGDFDRVNQIQPLGPTGWLKKIPLGKYRFVDTPQGRQYIPWTPEDLNRFLGGPWFVENAAGFAQLVHPRRKKAIDLNKKLNQFMAGQQKRAQQYPPSDPRHVYPIFPGAYVFPHSIDSTWTKIREPVVAAAAVVAAVYLGPAVVAKVKAVGAKAGVTSIGGAATQAQEVVDYVNKGRTVKAIVEGEVPPPPIDVSGAGFKNWVTDVAKKELTEKIQRDLTRDEEKALQDEIEQMQRELVAIGANKDVPRPAAELSPQVKSIMAAEEQQKRNLTTALIIGIPAALLLS